MELGVKIKKFREEKGIKQQVLANFLNIDQGKLSRIENGELRPAFELVDAIANYLKIPLNSFAPENLDLAQKITLRAEYEALYIENKSLKKTIENLQSYIDVLKNKN
jgi:transcriptional regulator with XRE-family HTH domain